jgi:iron complex transport system substrate-binding protein
LFELGLEGLLHGVTHECSYPPKALSKPKILGSSFDADYLNSSEIDKKITDLSVNKKPIFILDSQKVKEIKPDLIISQNLCEVCAPFDRDIHQIFSILGYKPRNLVLNPKNVYDVLDSIILIGHEVGHIERAHIVVGELTKRIEHIKQRIKINNGNGDLIRQKIICLEWISPFYAAGHWVPQMIEIVQGVNGIGKTGDVAKIISIDDIVKFDPDKIIIMPCGFDMKKTLKETTCLNNNEKWNSLRAVKMDETYVVDANSYFSKPGPRIVIGIEILARILYPRLFEDLKTPKKSFTKLQDNKLV